MTEEIKNEIDQMIKSLESSGNESTPELTPEPVIEPKSEVVEPKDTPAPEPQPEAKEEPKPTPEPVKEPEPDPRDKLIADLRAENESLRKPKEEEPPKPPEDADFVGDLDMDELSRDSKQLNKVLNMVYRKASDETRSALLQQLPEVVKTNLAVITTMKEATEKFYSDNPDLSSHKPTVAKVYEELVKSNPNKQFSDVMTEIAPEVRKRLNLTKPETIEKKEQPKEPPKLPGKGGRAGRTSESTPSNPLQDELEEMNKSLGR